MREAYGRIRVWMRRLEGTDRWEQVRGHYHKVREHREHSISWAKTNALAVGSAMGIVGGAMILALSSMFWQALVAVGASQFLLAFADYAGSVERTHRYRAESHADIVREAYEEHRSSMG